MQLMMYIGNDLIEAVTVSQENLRRPGYLGSFKRTLKLKHQELIQECNQPPEFLVVEVVIQPATKTQTQDTSRK